MAVQTLCHGLLGSFRTKETAARLRSMVKLRGSDEGRNYTGNYTTSMNAKDDIERVLVDAQRMTTVVLSHHRCREE